MSDEAPRVATWYGRRLEDLSKEELIRAVIELGEWNRVLCEGNTADRMMFGRIVKSMRPQ